MEESAKGGEPMIYRYADAAPVEVMPVLLRRTLVTGKSMMICEFTLDSGVEIPPGTNPQPRPPSRAGRLCGIRKGPHHRRRRELYPRDWRQLLRTVRRAARRTGPAKGCSCGHLQSAKGGLQAGLEIGVYSNRSQSQEA